MQNSSESELTLKLTTMDSQGEETEDIITVTSLESHESQLSEIERETHSEIERETQEWDDTHDSLKEENTSVNNELAQLLGHSSYHDMTGMSVTEEEENEQLSGSEGRTRDPDFELPSDHSDHHDTTNAPSSASPIIERSQRAKARGKRKDERNKRKIENENAQTNAYNLVMKKQRRKA